MSNESYFAEISKSFISESEKLETIINQLYQKSDKFPINEIILIYYQIINVTSLMQFLKQNISNRDSENLQTLLEKIGSISNLKNTGWVFAGTFSQKYQSDLKNEAGWGTLIEKNNLKSIQSISLPTVWTFHETEETPYIFAQRVSG